MILGMDPSFRNLAYSLYDGKKTIYMDRLSYPLGERIGFEKIFEACHDLWGQYQSSLDKLGVGKTLMVDTVISEAPPPVSQFSAGLFALDTFVLSKLFDTYSCIKQIYVVSPSYLGTIHGTAKYQKSDSTRLAKYFLDEVLEGKYKLEIADSISEKGRKVKGKLNNDRAESFLFLLRMFCKYDIGGDANLIGSTMSGLLYPAEKLLCSRP